MRAQTGAWTDSLMVKIRAAATMIPGTPPRAVHVLRFAGADVHQSEFLDGGGSERLRATLSVYQIRFSDGWITVSKELGEDRTAIQQQIEWLHNVMANVSLVNSHDDDSIAALIREGVLKEGLDLRLP